LYTLEGLHAQVLAIRSTAEAGQEQAAAERLSQSLDTLSSEVSAVAGALAAVQAGGPRAGGTGAGRPARGKGPGGAGGSRPAALLRPAGRERPGAPERVARAGIPQPACADVRSHRALPAGLGCGRPAATDPARARAAAPAPTRAPPRARGHPRWGLPRSRLAG